MRLSPPDRSTMTPFLRRLVALAALGLAFAMPARATTYSIDFSDIWWNAAESGWGINVIQRSDIIFATLFVYGQDNTARWYSATLRPSSPQPSGQTRFTGQLIRTTGPWFGAPTFTTPPVGIVPVGNMTLSFNSPVTGTLEYDVDGVRVFKQIARQPFGTENLAGQYQGGMLAIASQCANPSNNGLAEIPGTMVVTHSGSGANLRANFRISVDAASQSTICTFDGPYQQIGRMGTVSEGTWSCVIGSQTANSGTFTMTALDAQVNGFHASFIGEDQFCKYNGRFGGVRDVVGN
jgi:hypothetical protein